MGNKIQEVREQTNITQEDIARETGYSLSQIRNIEKGRSIPSVYVAIDIAKILGRSVEELFFKD